jgi:hypothetical protein
MKTLSIIKSMSQHQHVCRLLFIRLIKAVSINLFQKKSHQVKDFISQHRQIQKLL